jgi:glycosyltransferase involved in cell wall biosynthesis
VSDNASIDGTAAMISKLQADYPVPLTYFRFEQDMRGVRNFLNVVDISDAEYCWLIGSDDMLPPQSIAKVLASLETRPGLAGMTVNKLNFDRTLTTPLGPDHELVLPIHPAQSRYLDGIDIADNLGISFTYMSSHIFRRDAWQNVVDEFSRDRLCSTRHFPHTYIFLRIAEMSSHWYWLSDYCVIQRMGNFCILDENENFLYEYADEFTHDLIQVWDLTNTPPTVKKKLLNRLYFIFWNPISVLVYLSDPRLSFNKQKLMIRNTISRFGRLAKFWIFTFPILLIPAALCRVLMDLLDFTDRWTPARKLLYWLRSAIARGLSYARRRNESNKDAAMTSDVQTSL